MDHIKIKDVAIYHPDNVVDNDFYIDHFNRQGKDIRKFLAHMGREKRYIIDNDHENGLTMAINASKRALAKAGLTGRDLDMIIFSTQVPETTFPSNAMYVHDAIDASHDTIVYDSNANCAGMTVAVEQASHYLNSNRYMQRALIVGSDFNSLISNPQEEITYANYGDGAAAVILEKTTDPNGFIDSISFNNSATRDKIKYPESGLSQSLRGTAESDYIKWLPFDGAVCMPPTFDMIETLFARNNITAKDIKMFCLSQFALSNIEKFQQHFELHDEQIAYVGNKYGYTGTSSPFFAFHDSLEEARIQRGDYVLFWSVGAGFQVVAALFKY
ncbi:ketoacyl-ACP synthase III [Salipaludibacillus agaradhaerens]|uniref:ketoacyl-ACP synthase III n=1 Tax=Salipaludibacillus agaradhaerens TaxID=76935 RepID=UPI002151CBEC|nr:ketoacyl-ACP synthase III [Salipaludibacillus agaradhaerens]MCR6105068.1 ketoacyl-ACP synthase III [Salipaludibacillus agaradhaerens]MCR6117113.1 ketoacyl-ACP synthase III [Salipaludibacillus agaradhaerens]UJW56311.1 ketoacyl-ACP synthase III [Bacillus sp. A116_S68]